jgi:hypothetical protein
MLFTAPGQCRDGKDGQARGGAATHIPGTNRVHSLFSSVTDVKAISVMVRPAQLVSMWLFLKESPETSHCPAYTNTENV